MKIKKHFTFSNKRQIWRILPSDTGRLIIEERDTEKKEAYFSCVDIESGKTILNSWQPDEKYWLGIENVCGDLILFHGYQKPDMPGHLGITVFDVNSKKIVWKNDEYIYLFNSPEKIYAYKEMFDGRRFVVLDLQSGEPLEDLGEDADSVNVIMRGVPSQYDSGIYKFPEPLSVDFREETATANILKEFKNNSPVAGSLEFLTADGVLMFNGHSINGDGSLDNIFRAIEIVSKKVIFEEKLNRNIKAIVPDSFFLRGRYLFLLKEKTKVIVCSLDQ